MPTFAKDPSVVARAVKCVLEQTHRDLQLVVVNDGGTPLSGLPRDSRLVVFDLPVNRGRYFADAVVLHGAGGEAFAVHDSDDESHPDHLAQLYDGFCDDYASFGPVKMVEGERVRYFPAGVRDNLPLMYSAHWCSGLFSLDRLRRVGGIDPSYRTSYDSLLVALMFLSGDVNIVEKPTYTWNRTTNSLSLSRDDRHVRQLVKELEARGEASVEPREDESVALYGEELKGNLK